MSPNVITSRRSFLGSALTVTPFLFNGSSLLRAAESEETRRPISPRAFQARLRGPILSLPTPFTSDFDVDYEGVRRMITRASEAGVRVFSLTAGNSYYHALSYEEIKELTRIMVDAAGSEGMVIAAAGEWWTGRTLEYTRYAESIGASAIQLMLPTRADREGQIDYFRTIARNTRLGIVLHGNYPEDLVRKLIEIDSVVAMKEDVTLPYYINMQRKFGDRLVIFSGGPKYRFLVAQPYGAKAFYSLYSTFAPEIPMRFWKAIQQDDLDAAHDIVKTYEHPFFDRWSHAFWRASLEHFGVAQRYLRPPEKSFTDEQMEEVKAFFDDKDLYPPKD